MKNPVSDQTIPCSDCSSMISSIEATHNRLAIIAQIIIVISMVLALVLGYSVGFKKGYSAGAKDAQSDIYKSAEQEDHND